MRKLIYKCFGNSGNFLQKDLNNNQPTSFWGIKILIYFLPAILFLGIITSYQDIKEGKIRNKWVKLALVYAFLMNVLLILDHFFRKIPINTNYIIELITNFVFAVLVGFGMWHYKLWTAGDGKLFIAYAALIPLNIYSNDYQKWIPSFTLLINIFIPALIIMLIWISFTIKPHNLKNVLKTFLKEFFKPKQLFNSIISLFAVFWLIDILLSLVGLQNNYLLRITLTMFGLSAIQSKLKKGYFYIMCALVLLRFIMDKSIYSLSFLVDFLILIFVWKFFKSFLRVGTVNLGKELFTKDIEVDKLMPGMILGEAIHKKGKLTKKELNTIKKSLNTEIIRYRGEYFIKKPKSSIGSNNFIKEEAEGLTDEQITKIKKVGIKNIKISQTIPFAPFIFLGVVLTILAKGNILILVKNLF